MAQTIRVTPAFPVPDELKDIRWAVNPLNVTLIRPVYVEVEKDKWEVQTEILFQNTVAASSSMRVKEPFEKVREAIDAAIMRS